jgi:hypothetical protein
VSSHVEYIHMVCRSSEEELKKWEKGTLKLAALATLTGCPQVRLPPSLLLPEILWRIVLSVAI